MRVQRPIMLISSFLLGVVPSTVLADQVDIIADVNPGGQSEAEHLIVHAGRLWFVDRDAPFGPKALYVHDPVTGTTTQLVTNPGWLWNEPNRNPRPLVGLGTRVVFAAWTAETGYALWATDGTAAGTVMIADPDPSTVNGTFMTSANHLVHGGKLYFAVPDATHGEELWVTDGTAVGTHLVADTIDGSKSLTPTALTTVGGDFWFSGFTYDLSGGFTGAAAYVFDPDTDTAALLADASGPLVKGPLAFQPITVLGEQKVLIWNTDGLTLSDGTDIGTESLAARTASITGWAITSLGTRAFFVNSQTATGIELWVTDGTPETTRIVKDIMPGAGAGVLAGTSNPLVPFGSGVCFVGRNATSTLESEVWCSDGSEAGTQMVADLVAGGSGSSPAELTPAGDRLYFSAQVGAARGLYRYDGAEVSAVPIPGASSPAPTQIRPDGSVLYLTAVFPGLGRKIARIVTCPGCEIAGACVPTDEANPSNPCEKCDPAADPAGWSPAAGATCDDLDACTETDTCTDTGLCAGTAVSCPAPACTTATCDPSSGCGTTPIPGCDACTADPSSCTSDVAVGPVVQTALGLAGAPAEIRIDFGNAGPDPADVILQITIPEGATVGTMVVEDAIAAPAFAPPKIVSCTAAAPAGGVTVHSCPVGVVASGASLTATAAITGLPSGDSALVVGALAPSDIDSENNLVASTVTVFGGSVSVTITSPQPGETGDAGPDTVTLEITNTAGSAPLTGLEIDIDFASGEVRVDPFGFQVDVGDTGSQVTSEACQDTGCHVALDTLAPDGVIYVTVPLVACTGYTVVASMAANVGTFVLPAIPEPTVSKAIATCEPTQAVCRFTQCSLTAGCVDSDEVSGVPCDDLDGCTENDVCNGAGACAGTPVTPCDTCANDPASCTGDVYVGAVTQDGFVKSGDDAMVSATFGNSGPDPLEASVSVAVPAGATVTVFTVTDDDEPSGPPTTVTCSDAGTAGGIATVSCPVGSLPAGAARTAHVTVSDLPDGESPLSVSVESTGDANDGNNQVTSQIFVFGGNVVVAIADPLPDAVVAPGPSGVTVELSAEGTVGPITDVTVTIGVSGPLFELDAAGPTLQVGSTSTTVTSSSCIATSCTVVLDQIEPGGLVGITLDLGACFDYVVTAQVNAKANGMAIPFDPLSPVAVTVADCTASNKPCVTAQCQPMVGCVDTPDDSAACDDGDPCTKDACIEGACVSTSACAPGPCEQATCTAGECTYTALPDASACPTPDDGCFVGGCKAGACELIPIKQCPKSSDACLENRCQQGDCTLVPIPNADPAGCQNTIAVTAAPSGPSLPAGAVTFSVDVDIPAGLSSADLAILIEGDPLSPPEVAIVGPTVIASAGAAQCAFERSCSVFLLPPPPKLSVTFAAMVCSSFDLDIRVVGNSPTGLPVASGTLHRSFTVAGDCSPAAALEQVPPNEPAPGGGTRVVVRAENQGTTALPVSIGVAATNADGSPTGDAVVCGTVPERPVACDVADGTTICTAPGETLAPGQGAVFACDLPAGTASATATYKVPLQDDAVTLELDPFGDPEFIVTLTPPPPSLAVGAQPLELLFAAPGTVDGELPKLLRGGPYRLTLTLEGAAGFTGGGEIVQPRLANQTPLDCFGRTCRGVHIATDDDGEDGDYGYVNDLLRMKTNTHVCGDFTATAVVEVEESGGAFVKRAEKSFSYTVTGSCPKKGTLQDLTARRADGVVTVEGLAALTVDDGSVIYPRFGVTGGQVTFDTATLATDAGTAIPSVPCADEIPGFCFEGVGAGAYRFTLAGAAGDGVTETSVALSDQLAGTLNEVTTPILSSGPSRFQVTSTGPADPRNETPFEIQLHVLGASESVGKTTISLQHTAKEGGFDLSASSAVAGAASPGYPVAEVVFEACGAGCARITLPRVDMADATQPVVELRLRMMVCSPGFQVTYTAAGAGSPGADASGSLQVTPTGACGGEAVSVVAPANPVAVTPGSEITLATVEVQNTTPKPFSITGFTTKISSTQTGWTVMSPVTIKGSALVPAGQTPPPITAGSPVVGKAVVDPPEPSNGGQTQKVQFIGPSGFQSGGAATLANNQAMALAALGAVGGAGLVVVPPPSPPRPPVWLLWLAVVAWLAVTLVAALRRYRPFGLAAAAAVAIMACAGDSDPGGPAATGTLKLSVEVVSITAVTEDGETRELLSSPLSAGSIVVGP